MNQFFQVMCISQQTVKSAKKGRNKSKKGGHICMIISIILKSNVAQIPLFFLPAMHCGHILQFLSKNSSLGITSKNHSTTYFLNTAETSKQHTSVIFFQFLQNNEGLYPSFKSSMCFLTGAQITVSITALNEGYIGLQIAKYQGFSMR